MALVPPASTQYAEIRRRVVELSAAGVVDRPAPATADADRRGTDKGKLAGLGVAGMVLWKFKWIVAFAFTKLKFLLLGLTKVKTLFSMVLTLGVYWTLWGWPFALGFVLSIYVHEIGHVSALRRLGIAASAPMFIPGLGAFVRMHQYPATPTEDARVGLAGPVWGLGAAIACYGLFLVTGSSLLAGVAHAGAWVNLFNLLPIWQLDGGRAMNAMTRTQRWSAASVIGASWFATGESLLLLLLLAAVWRALAGQVPDKPDRGALLTYGLLVVVLSGMTMLHVPGLPTGSR